MKHKVAFPLILSSVLFTLSVGWAGCTHTRNDSYPYREDTKSRPTNLPPPDTGTGGSGFEGGSGVGGLRPVGS
jgi:hypothetical protein